VVVVVEEDEEEGEDDEEEGEDEERRRLWCLLGVPGTITDGLTRDRETEEDERGVEDKKFQINKFYCRRLG